MTSPQLVPFSIVKVWKLSAKFRIKIRVPSLTLLFNMVIEVGAREIRQGRERECIQIVKEDMKSSLFADEIWSYIENPKDSAKKVLEKIYRLRKLQDSKLMYTI